MPVLILTSITILILDQIIKYVVKTKMHLYESISIIKDILNITYIQNPGVSFGLLGGSENEIKRWILVLIIAFAIVLVTVYWFTYRQKNFFYNFASGLILGGALGNFIDRLLIGKVIDFIDVGYKNFRWPVFNFADTSISTGIGILIFYFLFLKQKEVN